MVWRSARDLSRAMVVACLLVACKATERASPGTAGSVVPAAATSPAEAQPAAPPTAPEAARSVAAPPAAAPPSFRGEIDKRFVADLQAVYADYKGWGRVDDELRFAPWLCRMPEPGMAHVSAAEQGAHGRKLYSLFARDHAGYVALGKDGAKPAKGLQAVVKESYLPEEITGEPIPRHAWNRAAQEGPLGAGDHFWPYARGEGGKLVKAGAVAGLFVVLEKPAGTPGTDDGFVYGTMTPSGEITSAGKVGPCLACHEKAKHRRFFGTQPAF